MVVCVLLVACGDKQPKPFTRTEIVDVGRDGDGWAFKVHFPQTARNTRGGWCGRTGVGIQRDVGGTWVDEIDPRAGCREGGVDGMVMLVEETTTLRWDGNTRRGRAARGKYRAVIDGATAEFEID